MKKLESKIINKIYKLETKKTLSQIFGEIIFTILIILSSVFIFSIIIEILNEQGSFGLLEFYRSDLEIIKYYLIQNTWSFIQELPFPLVCILILLVVAFILLIYILFKNFNKIKNKLVLLYKFWFK